MGATRDGALLVGAGFTVSNLASGGMKDRSMRGSSRKLAARPRVAVVKTKGDCKCKSDASS